MSRFLDRFLPRTERRTALWLAFGGAGVRWVAGTVGGLAREQMRSIVLEDPLPTSSVYAVVALVEFAAVALVVATLIRFARAPKAIALYVALGARLTLFWLSSGSPRRSSTLAAPQLPDSRWPWRLGDERGGRLDSSRRRARRARRRVDSDYRLARSYPRYRVFG